MAHQLVVKEFSAERRMKVQNLGGEKGVSNADLYLEIQELRGEIGELRRQRAAAPSPIDAAQPDPMDPDDFLAARFEIAQMVRVIGRAKIAIASIKHPGETADRMQLAASELDALVVATAMSTEDVFGAR